MSDLLQTGQHPDADQLSAFAEHALPAHEYEQTLAHLAICPDCRSVVTLSMPPIAEAPEPQPDVARKPWFFGWKFALPAAAALAALIILIVETRTAGTRPRSDIPTQEATLNSPLPTPLPQNEAPVPASNPTASISPNTARSVRPLQSASPAKLKAAPPATPRSTVPTAIAGRALETLTPHGLTTAGSPPSNPSAAAPVGGIFSDTSEPLSQNITVNGAAAPATPSTSPTAIAGSIAGPIPPAPAKPTLPPVTNASAVSLGRAAAPIQRAAPSAVHGVALGIRAIPSTQTPLPSNLPAISVVSVAHRKLAIDTHNTLFLSLDDGKNWKAVPPQWQGHAMRVALVSSIAPAQPATMVTAAAAAPAANFAAPKVSPPPAPPPTEGSTLTGTITDPSGAIIPNADVIVTRKGTSESRTLKADITGNYRVDNLAPGDYQVAARASGFREAVSTINVATSEPLLANFTLNIGSAAESVSVQASPVALAEIPSSSNELLTLSADNPLPAVFEITTSEGEHWTSADGQTWKHK